MSFQNARIEAKDANPEEYHKQKGERGTIEFEVSSSSLRLFDACPSKFIHGFEMAPSASLEYGALFDLVCLTPDQFEKRYSVQPETYESTGMKCPNCEDVQPKSKKCSTCKCERVEVQITKKWSGQSTTCEAWFNEQVAAGKEVCTTKELADAQAAAKRLFDDPIIGDYIRESDKQVWIAAEWKDEPTGLIVPVKCLVDLLPRRTSEFFQSVADLKSTKCAEQISWCRFADRVGYDIQGAWNLDLIKAALPDESRCKFNFILSESHAPWEPSRVQMEDDAESGEGGLMANARADYKRIMAGYCQCLKTGKWPGYAQTDETSTDGWNIWALDPRKAERDMFAPRYAFGGEVEQEVTEEQPEIVDFRH